MKPISNYEHVRGYENSASQLPVGGYVLKITGVRYETGTNGNSDRIIVAFDVNEGEFAGFFAKRFNADQSEDRKWKGTTTLYIPKEDGSEQDEWTTRKFKTFTNALEDSNKGYKWDWEESKWKGLLIGGVFGEVYTLIDGRQVRYTTFKSSASVENVRKGDFKTPRVQYKNGASANAVNLGPSAANEDFMQIKDGDEDIPF